MTRLFIIILSFCFVNISSAQNILNEIDSLIKNVQTSNSEIGISVGLVFKNNQHFFSYGNVNRQDNHKVNNKTIFEIGSVTKLMTSYLITQQAELGKIDLDNYMDDYFPSHIKLNSAIQKKIKVSDLASHQSGLPDFDLPYLLANNSEHPFDEVTKEMVDSILTNTSDLSSQGTYKYSNISYVLLGYILENVCNDSYENILQQNILDPLKMNRTMTSAFNEHNNQTIGYNANNEPRSLFNWNSIFAPAGLIKSNSSDILKFLIELLNQENAQINNKLENTYFKNTFIELGLGLNILRAGENVIYAKSGDSLGQSCVLGYNPEKEWGMIILTNQASGTARQLFSEIIEILK